MTILLTPSQQADIRALTSARDQANAQLNLYVKAIVAGHEGFAPTDGVHIDLDGGVIVLTPSQGG